MAAANSTTAEIPFWFHDRPKWVSGINRHTTCQDILHSLVKAHADKSKRPVEDEAIKATTQQLALVEQWRGVERPLSNSSKILKLWNAWGEERSQVRFVVKRITSSADGTSSGATMPPGVRVGTRKTRRRNSRLSSSGAGGRSSSAGPSGGPDTVHPSALSRNSTSRLLSSSSSSSSGSEIERLMRIILTQGETIHSQLKKLQEREGQIESIEQEVHDSRTKTAGKDYLLNAYLEESNGGPTSPRDIPECLSEMVDALSKVHGLNEKLEATEERLSDLQGKLTASSSPTHPDSLEVTRGEVGRLRSLNQRVDQEIDENRLLISSMRSAFDERRALVDRLERDVNHIESEGAKLEIELERAVMRRSEELNRMGGEIVSDRIPMVPSPPGFAATDEDLLDEELINDILGPPPQHIADDEDQYRLSNSQLYGDRKFGDDDPNGRLYEALRKLHIRTTASVIGGVGDAARISATGSPGSNSSTSGNSSGGYNTGSEKSVRFSERDLIMATPDLPPLPSGDFPGAGTASSSRPGTTSSSGKSPTSQYTKSILKTVDASGDLDSNSDTGLSSLHSSSDEGTYVLDTLV